MKYAPYSLSKIEVFKQCKKKFFYQYIQKLPSVQGAEAKRGSRIHDLIMFSVETEETEKALKQKLQMQQILHPADFEAKKQACIDYAGYEDITIVGRNGQSLLLENFQLAVNPVEIKEMPLGTARDHQGRFQSRFGGYYASSDYNSPETLIRGVADYVRIDLKDIKAPICGDNVSTIELIDWKTGKNLSAKSQLLIYAFLLAIRFNIDASKINARYEYLQLGRSVPVKVQEEEMLNAVRYFEDVIEQVEMYDFDQMQESSSALCKWCSYENECKKNNYLSLDQFSKILGEKLCH